VIRGAGDYFCLKFTMLSIHSLRHLYDSRVAVVAPDLELARGAHCALLGPSRCGKTPPPRGMCWVRSGLPNRCMPGRRS
jgi:ABC-type phosphate transport system ATPase subunit